MAVRHSQTTLHQVELQRYYTVHPGELVPDQPFLGRAVHVDDGQHRSRLIDRRVYTLCLHTDCAQGVFDRRKRIEPMSH